jgi:putative alpha-1,2-mannosidase
MSAWYVISSLGFYAVDPVSANYVFGSPLFDRAEVNLGGGRKLVVEVKRDSADDPYIQSITFNGKPHTKLWFRHADLADGATIVFTMGGKPNEEFGAGQDAIPPSLVL